MSRQDRNDRRLALLFCTLGAIGLLMVVTNGFGIKTLNNGPVKDTGPSAQQVRLELKDDRNMYNGEVRLHAKYPDVKP